MKLLGTLICILLMGATPAKAAGFHETTFDLITAGTLYFGASPVYSSSTYEASAASIYTSWGYQLTAGFDHSLNETFGGRGYLSYAHTNGANTANTNTIYEKTSVNDIELGVMGTFNGFALGGGFIRRSMDVDYVNGQTNISNSFSGLLKFAKASLDFTSKEGTMGFSLSESYVFGNISDATDSTTLKTTEFKSLFHVFYLLNLK